MPKYAARAASAAWCFIAFLLFFPLPSSAQTVVPAPWISQDIGDPALAGSADHAPDRFTVRAAGKDISGSSDQFHFVHQLLTGDGELVARVESLAATHVWAKAGVMMRDSLTANSVHAFVQVTGGQGIGFQRRASAGTNSTTTSGTKTGVPYWVRLRRQGDIFRAFESPDGTTWRQIGEQSIGMRDTIYVGLAVTSRNTTRHTTAAISGVTVAEAAPATTPPSVTLTSPGTGSTYTSPATVGLAATASATGATIARIDFYADTTLVASATTSPCSTSWNNVAAGTYSLTARATDTAGATATSPPVSITVNSATNQPPTVAITSPANGAAFTAPATIAISASASDSDGTVTRVDFYSGSTLIGSDTSHPYSISWNNVPAGTYTLTARATDNQGATTTSNAASITVNGTTNKPPAVSLTSPASASTFTAPAAIGITASASDPDGTIARVDFFVGTTLLASDTTSPYSTGWNVLAAGTYTLTARASDNAGTTTTSAPVTVTANPTRALFTASPDHATLVTSYRLEIFVAGANPSTATPVATRDLGKPTPSSGEIDVDITFTLASMASGSYIATVSAIGSGGSSRSAPSATFAR